MDLDRQIKSQLRQDEHNPLIVTLTSGGGSVGYARAIYEELSLLQEVADVTLVTRGICLSAAVTVAMAFPQQNRYATPNTKFLMHEGYRPMSQAVGGSLSARRIHRINADSDFEDDVDEAKWVTNVISQGCKQPYEKVERKLRQSTWLVGHKAVKFGLVGGILGEHAAA
jgi:ATP-dependent Clp protease protease subunit